MLCHVLHVGCMAGEIASPCTTVHRGCAFVGWVAGDVSLMTSIYLSVLARAADSYKLRLHVLHDLAWVESSLV